ncbi:MAG: nicotinate phosphoribosyltransferase, partial [Comamonas sp.]
VWFRNTTTADFAEGERRLQAKTALLRDTPGFELCRIADYGSRRRYSRDWHARLLPLLRDALGPQLVGTSNVHFARLYGMTPHGTMAHEYLQASQVAALESWAREYRGDLGIALSDVVGLDAFLRDFDMYFCKLFDGVRHDSGDPFDWGDRMLAHFQQRRVDARSKVLVFSDGLDITKVMRLYDYFRGRCQVAFGVGT